MEPRKKVALVAGLVLFVIGLVLIVGGPAIVDGTSDSAKGKGATWGGVASALVGMGLVGVSLMGK